MDLNENKKSKKIIKESKVRNNFRSGMMTDKEIGEIEILRFP